MAEAVALSDLERLQRPFQVLAARLQQKGEAEVDSQVLGILSDGSPGFGRRRLEHVGSGARPRR
jgi:hypothetical protein